MYLKSFFSFLFLLVYSGGTEGVSFSFFTIFSPILLVTPVQRRQKLNYGGHNKSRDIGFRLVKA